MIAQVGVTLLKVLVVLQCYMRLIICLCDEDVPYLATIIALGLARRRAYAMSIDQAGVKLLQRLI